METPRTQAIAACKFIARQLAATAMGLGFHVPLKGRGPGSFRVEVETDYGRELFEVTVRRLTWTPVPWTACPDADSGGLTLAARHIVREAADGIGA